MSSRLDDELSRLVSAGVLRQYQADLLGLDIRTVHHEGRANIVLFAESRTAIGGLEDAWADSCEGD